MNPNRQNGCYTPAGAGGPRQMGRTANVVTNTPCGANSCGCGNMGASSCGNGGTTSCGNTGTASCGNTGTASCGNNTTASTGNGCGAASGIVTGACQTMGCNRETALSGMPIAMAYVPWQSYGSLYSLPQALQNGTLFGELNLDFAGRRCN